MRTYGLFYIAGLCTLAQIATAVFIDVPANWAAASLALLLGLCGALFIYWPMFVLYRHGGVPQGAGTLQATAVVDRGPYTVIRHPQYLGYMLINLTFILSNPHPLGIAFGVAAIACFYLYTRQEDGRLLDTFGATYQEYMQRVPGFNVAGGLLRLARDTGGRS